MQHPTSTDIQRVRDFLLDLQARICASLEQQERAGGGTAENRRLRLHPQGPDLDEQPFARHSQRHPAASGAKGIESA